MLRNMFLRKSLLFLMIFLVISTASAARKTKRPIKPAKTFPRTNVAPLPAQISGSANQQPATSTTTSTTAAPIKQENSIVEEANQTGNVNGSELPKQLDAAATNQANGNVQPLLRQQEPRTEMPTNLPEGNSKETDIMEEECDPDMIGFEIVTGYVLSAPLKMLDTLPGTLMLTDCLEACQANESCQAANYETGLCVLFQTTSDKTPGSLSRSQFPVFTIHAQKICLGVRPCSKAWCIDRVLNYRLVENLQSRQTVSSRRDCMELCLGETEFTCRSANYYRQSGLCELSDMDRITLSSSSTLESYDGADYLENNCAEEPSKLCEFKRLSGKILKTVDSVYQDINTIDECRDLCLNSPYRCHSYDYNDTGEMVCRLSHHSRATLSNILEPYLEVPEAATYELSSCYNVSIECKAGEMITKIRTSKVFDGKVYAKGSPKLCSINVNNSLEFDFRMGYNDLECNVRQSASGRYMNDIIIQHHDMIVTSSDLGLAVSCQFDLTNKTVSNNIDLSVTGEIESSLSEEITIDSPNVVMKITSRDGSEVKGMAKVGDPLALRFEISDPNSPYEIFVRELVSLDGTGNAEITLIDSQGCPTDQLILGSIEKISQNRKVLVTQFDAFKFPSSDVVQFRALVTPCIPTCEPVICDNEDSAADEDSLMISYGRKKRSIQNGIDGAEFLVSLTNLQRQERDVSQKTGDKILLTESIQITDKFGFNKEDSNALNSEEKREKIYSAISEKSFTCLNGYGLIVAGAVFLLAQLTIYAIWKTVQNRSQKERYLYHQDSVSSSVNYGPPPTMVYNASLRNHAGHQQQGTASDTLGKLYDSGMTGRYGQQF